VKDDHFEIYNRMRREGTSANQAFLQAQKDGLDWSAQIRMLRAVYRLSLEEAKEVMVTADGSSDSLVEHQKTLLSPLEHLLRKEPANMHGKKRA
jgi:hypothetical protein